MTAARRAAPAAAEPPPETGPVLRRRRRTCRRTPAAGPPADQPGRLGLRGAGGRRRGRGRGLSATGSLSGGALLPAPGGASDWWGRYLAVLARPRHRLGGARRAVPRAARRSSRTLLLGKAWLVVDLLFLLAVPLAAFGAYRFLRRVTASVADGLWGAVAYGVLPVVTGAVQQGRLGTVAARRRAALAGALRAVPRVVPRTPTGAPGPPGGARCGWRCSSPSCPPPGSLAAAVVTLVVVADPAASDGPRTVATRRASRWSPRWCCCCRGRCAAWALPGLAGVLFEAGLPSPRLTEPLTRWDVLARPSRARVHRRG